MDNRADYVARSSANSYEIMHDEWYIVLRTEWFQFKRHLHAAKWLHMEQYLFVPKITAAHLDLINPDYNPFHIKSTQMT